MAILCKILGELVQIENGIWSSPDARFTMILRDFEEINQGSDPTLHGGLPDPDYSSAQAMIRKLGGEIVHQDPPPESEDGVVY